MELPYKHKANTDLKERMIEMAKEAKKERKQRVVRSFEERIADAKEKFAKYKRLAKKEEEIIAALEFKRDNPNVGRASVKLDVETMAFLQKEGVKDVSALIKELVLNKKQNEETNK